MEYNEFCLASQGREGTRLSGNAPSNMSMTYSDRHPETHPLKEPLAEIRPQPWDKNLILDSEGNKCLAPVLAAEQGGARIQTQALGFGPSQHAGQPRIPGSPRPPFPSHTAIWDGLIDNGHLKVRLGQTLASTIVLVPALITESCTVQVNGNDRPELGFTPGL